MLERFGGDVPAIEDGDLELISRPLDYLGVNNYTRQIVRGEPGRRPPDPRRRPARAVHRQGLGGLSRTAFTTCSSGCTRTTTRPPIYVMENGAAFSDVRGHDGRVADPERCAYLESYIAAVGRAIDAGVPVKGYFVWSLLDNFEWAAGYSERFGIVYVDYPTLERVPKYSFAWYRDFISAQRAPGSVTASARPG